MSYRCWGTSLKGPKSQRDQLDWFMFCIFDSNRTVILQKRRWKHTLIHPNSALSQPYLICPSCSSSPHAGHCTCLHWLTASLRSLCCSEHDSVMYGTSAASLIIWQDTESLLTYVKGGSSGYNICARACAHMPSVCRGKELAESHAMHTRRCTHHIA